VSEKKMNKNKLLVIEGITVAISVIATVVGGIASYKYKQLAIDEAKNKAVAEALAARAP
jgi:hypothetical protein